MILSITKMCPAQRNRFYFRKSNFHFITAHLQVVFLFCLISVDSNCQAKPNQERKNVLVLYENKGHHKAFTDRAVPWLRQLAADSSYELTLLTNTKGINTNFLQQFNLILQLDYVPYGWTDTAKKALKSYLEEGRGSWIGLHHAGLLGAFDGFPMWEWFSFFMGDIQYKNYIADFASGTVINEDNTHQVMKGLPDTFRIAKEEWYIWNRSPRPRVHVLASVDEKTYSPDSKIKMGDHPVIWTNADVKTKNIYIFMGHDPALLDDRNYTHLLQNAIAWSLLKN